MRNLTTTLCLTFAVLLGSEGVSWSADFQKSKSAWVNGNYLLALEELTPADAYFGRHTAIIERREKIKKLTTKNRRLIHQR